RERASLPTDCVGANRPRTEPGGAAAPDGSIQVSGTALRARRAYFEPAHLAQRGQRRQSAKSSHRARCDDAARVQARYRNAAAIAERTQVGELRNPDGQSQDGDRRATLQTIDVLRAMAVCDKSTFLIHPEQTAICFS